MGLLGDERDGDMRMFSGKAIYTRHIVLSYLAGRR
jgi:hypothetical protein